MSHVLQLVIFGTSNMISDLVDAAWTHGIATRAIVQHDPEPNEVRSIPIAERVKRFKQLGGVPEVLTFEEFSPMPNDIYILGPTTPTRKRLADAVKNNWGLTFTKLIHRTAYVSPLTELAEGVYVGANSVIAPGTKMEEHVFINRGVTIGHDNRIGAYSRIQPGVSIGGLSDIGRGVTVGLGARMIERLQVGDGAIIAGGAVVLNDVDEYTLVAGVPAKFKKNLIRE